MMTREVFDAVDALLERPVLLPSPAVRAGLRRAAGLTQTDVAQALGVHRIQVLRWEAGAVKPRKSNLMAYAQLLDGLAARYPASAYGPTDAAVAD
ncbi:helix-turn-helix domain-containing protein [Streptomyces lavendulocolor]|uniref:helix-turn-helix domain-containing protein n=1 Tax=Streptomyces lavendulocolor TaxID=67316 RepID=UPI0033E8F8E9